MGVNVEIKNFAHEPDFDAAHWLSQAVVEAARRADPPVSVLVSSFNIDAIDRVHALAPTLPTALLTFLLDDPLATLARCAANGHRALHPYDATVDRALVVDPRTIAGSRSMSDRRRARSHRALVAMGVGGICTNVRTPVASSRQRVVSRTMTRPRRVVSAKPRILAA